MNNEFGSSIIDFWNEKPNPQKPPTYKELNKKADEFREGVWYEVESFLHKKIYMQMIDDGRNELVFNADYSKIKKTEQKIMDLMKKK